ncbi:hypothetical protein NDU88_006575 [Pleurodeles waltl]|uniref:Uncharacterized protein n=1 Tax=Pleurodeles waltl TaxID=8319 RepID=A0AAV7MHU3_PLEWA|nr:hypothetical protein NDU88_006575 [Pleurodeles waltl]
MGCLCSTGHSTTSKFRPPSAKIEKSPTPGYHKEHPTSLEDKLDRILLATEDSKMSLETKIDPVASDLTLLHADHRKVADKVVMAEQSIETLQPKTQSRKSSLETLADCVQILEQGAEDTEGRSVKNNVCLVGLPEGTEETQ